MACCGRKISRVGMYVMSCAAQNWSKFLFLVHLIAVICHRSLSATILGDFSVTGRSDAVCPAEEFPCRNSSMPKCLSRSFICDNFPDCPDGEDEENCDDTYGSLAALVKGMTHHKKEIENVELYDTSLNNYNCSLENFPIYCQCRFVNFLYCGSENLTSIPEGIKGTLKKLVVTNSSLTHFRRGAFAAYRELKVIAVEGGNIRVITPGPFVGLTRLTFLILMRNNIEKIEPGAFEGVENLVWLLMQNNAIVEMDMVGVLKDLTSLRVLDLAENKLTNLKEFPLLEALFWLGLAKNKIKYIGTRTFRNLTSLEVLILKNNVIEDIEECAFEKLTKLVEIDISHNRLKHLKPKIFASFKNLKKMNLEFNLIVSFPVSVFRKLHSLKSLDLQGLEINNIDTELFEALRSLEFIYFKRFGYCSRAPHVRICMPRTDGLSSTENLLVWPAFRICLWCMALTTTAGNTVVLTWRVLSRKEDRVLSLFIKHLAFADFIMGIYLIAIGAEDVALRDQYNTFAQDWRASWKCKTCGVAAMISCEVSVLILSFITLERFHSIRTNVRFVTIKSARYSLAAIWFAGFVLAITPVLKYSEVKGGFYESSSLCFPLHIDDPFLRGWQYGAFVFIGINFSAVILIISLYIWMFCIIKKDRQSARPVILKKHEDIFLAIRFFLIAVTDALCWIPIVLIKLLALFGVTISRDLYAFVVIFILPINSSLNPVLYTVWPTELRKSIEKSLERTLACLQNFKCFVRSDGQTPTSTPLTQSTTTDRSISSGSILPSSAVVLFSPSTKGGTERYMPHQNRKDSNLSTSI